MNYRVTPFPVFEYAGCKEDFQKWEQDILVKEED